MAFITNPLDYVGWESFIKGFTDHLPWRKRWKCEAHFDRYPKFKTTFLYPVISSKALCPKENPSYLPT